MQRNTTDTPSKGFTAEERAAIRERAREQKAAAGRAEAERDALAKIGEMTGSDRAIAERLHALITTGVPALSPRTWYGMPAYAKDGDVVCFFQPAQKFKTRYATLGFSDRANLDDGDMWPAYYALKRLTGDDEARVLELVRRAAS